MNLLVIGGCASGKSAFAESAAQKLGGSLVYVATMPVVSPEDQKAVDRHRRMRSGKGFTTLERPWKLAPLPGSDKTLLVECIATHTANLMFAPGENPLDTARWTEVLKSELEPIILRNKNTVWVSSSVDCDGIQYSKETEAYKKVLNDINCYLAEKSDAVVEMVCGIPVRIKGDFPC